MFPMSSLNDLNGEWKPTFWFQDMGWDAASNNEVSSSPSRATFLGSCRFGGMTHLFLDPPWCRGLSFRRLLSLVESTSHTLYRWKIVCTIVKIRFACRSTTIKTLEQLIIGDQIPPPTVHPPPSTPHRPPEGYKLSQCCRWPSFGPDDLAASEASDLLATPNARCSAWPDRTGKAPQSTGQVLGELVGTFPPVEEDGTRCCMPQFHVQDSSVMVDRRVQIRCWVDTDFRRGSEFLPTPTPLLTQLSVDFGFLLPMGELLSLGRYALITKSQRL